MQRGELRDSKDASTAHFSIETVSHWQVHCANVLLGTHTLRESLIIDNIRAGLTGCKTCHTIQTSGRIGHANRLNIQHLQMYYTTGSEEPLADSEAEMN